MAIEGSKREIRNFDKYVGIFEGEVVAINPTVEEFQEILGITLSEESKAAEYLGESKDGNPYVRINFWFRDVKTKEIFPSSVSFFLENKERLNKEETKKQYINTAGMTCWAEDETTLPDWFVGSEEKKIPFREYRPAMVGEEEFYEFLKHWLGKLDLRTAKLDIEWKKLIKGNVNELKEQMGGEYESTIGLLATVVTKEKDDGPVEYQNIYNKAFLPPYAIKHFRLVDYHDKNVITRIAAKKPKDQKPHEKFVLKVVGEYGCHDTYILKDLQEYDPSMSIVASDKVISEEGADY